MKDHLPVLLFLAPLLAAPLALALGRVSRPIGYLGLGLGLWAALAAFPRFLESGDWHYALGGWAPPWGIEILLTPYTGLLLGMILAMGLLTLWAGGPDFPKEGIGRSFFSPALLLLVSGLGILLTVRDLFSLYLAGLLAVVAIGGILSSFSVDPRSLFRFILSGAASAGLFLWGVLVLHSASGSLHFEDLRAQLFIAKDVTAGWKAGTFLTAGVGALLGLSLPPLSGGLLRQLAAAAAGFLAAAVPRVGLHLFFLLYYFTLNVPGTAVPASVAWTGFGICALLLLGFTAALRQSGLLNALLYLSLAQSCFILAGFHLGDKTALSGALMEILCQVPALCGLFFLAGLLGETKGGPPLKALSGLGWRRFRLGVALTVFLASLTGIPPLGGFFGKYYLVLGAMEKGAGAVLALVAAAVLLQAAFLVKVLRLAFEHPEPGARPLGTGRREEIPVLLLAAAVLLLGLFHQDVMRAFIDPALPKAFLETPLPNVPFLGTVE